MLIYKLNVIWGEEGSRKWEKTVFRVTSYRKEEMKPNQKPHQNKQLIYKRRKRERNSTPH